MFHACRGAARSCRSFFAIASGLVVASCSSAGGSGTGAPADTGNSAAPVLRTANGQQVFGAGGTDSSSGNAAASAGSKVAESAVGATPAESREALNNPVLASPDAGSATPPPAAPKPPPSAAPSPSDPPSVPFDDDDDDDDDDDEEEEEDDD